MYEHSFYRSETRGGTGPVVSSFPRIGIQQVWLLLPVFLIIYKGFIFPLPPLDFWWHLKMGEVIATTGSIPHVDTFSFTAAGRPFVLQNWLGELIYYATYRAGGFPLLVFLGTAITVAGFLLMYRLCLDATPNRRIVAVIGFLASLGNYGFLRPQTYSFLLFAAFYFVLTQYRDRRRDRLWLLPILMVLWVNLHGAFVLGLGIIAIYIGCESCRRFIHPSRSDALSTAQIRKLVLVLFFCGAATLLNPEGYRIYDYVRAVMLDPGSQQLVAEWRPPRVNDLLGFLLFYCPFFVGLFTFVHARVRPDLTETVLFFGFAFLGLTAIRNAAWFSTVAYPLIARYLPLLDFRPLQSLRRFEPIDRFLEPPNPMSDTSDIPSLGNGLLLIAAVLLLASQSPWIRPRLSDASLLAQQIPTGAAEFIQKQGFTGRMFHPQEFGDYFMWRLWPQQKTFVDGRVHLFSLDFLEQYNRTIENPLSTDLLDRWNIQYMMLSKVGAQTRPQAIQAIEHSGAWKKLYEDDVAVLFEKSPLSGSAGSARDPDVSQTTQARHD